MSGSTAPRLVEDQDGKKWVSKKGNNEGHLRSEALADELYRRAGLDVPAGGLVESPKGPYKFTEYLKGDTLDEWRVGKDKAEVDAMYSKIQDGFVADALFANWDVAGLNHDNIMIVDGKPFRIDNGGSLDYRAQGAKKNNWGGIVHELDTLRNPNISSSASKIFKNISEERIHGQIKDLLGKRESILSAVPDTAMRETLGKRLDFLKAQLPKKGPEIDLGVTKAKHLTKTKTPKTATATVSSPGKFDGSILDKVGAMSNNTKLHARLDRIRDMAKTDPAKAQDMLVKLQNNNKHGKWFKKL